MPYIDPTGKASGWSLFEQPGLGLTQYVETLPENELAVAVALGCTDEEINASMQ